MWTTKLSRMDRQNCQLADPALAARLLRVRVADLLQGTAPAPLTPKDGGLLGALFESLVTLSVRVYAQGAEAEVNHFRTYRGDREVDLIVKGESGRVLAVEVKLAAAPAGDAGAHLTGSRASSATSCSTNSSSPPARALTGALTASRSCRPLYSDRSGQALTAEELIKGHVLWQF